MREFTIFLDKDGTITLEKVPETNCNFTSFHVSTGIRIFLDGYIADTSCLGNTEKKNILHALYESIIRKKKYDLLPLLNGHYNLIIIDETTKYIIIITDHYGLRTFYFSKTARGYVLSNSVKKISECQDFENKINNEAIFDFIKFEFVMNEATFFKNINRFKPGTINFFTTEKHSFQQYTPWFTRININSNTIDENTEAAFSLFKKSVKRVMQGVSCPGVTISGGLDSRVIAGLITLLKRSPPAFFHCLLSAEETSAAQGVVETLGGEMTSLSLPGNSERILSLPIELGDGCTSLNQFWLHYLYRDIIANTSVDCVYDGFYLDVLMDPLPTSMFYDNSLIEQQVKSKNLKAVVEALFGLPHGYFQQYFSDSLYPEMEQVALENADFFASDIETDISNQFCQSMYLKTRGNRYILPMANANQNFCPVRFPGLDYDLIEFCMTLPPSQVKQPLVYLKLFKRFLPELSQVEWSRTGKPLSDGIINNKHLTSAFCNRLTFYLLRLSRGRVDLHTPKKNLSYVFRKDIVFRGIVLGLFHNNFCIEHGMISRRGFNLLVHNILIGKNDYFILERLLAIELFFTSFYNVTDS